MCLAHMCMCVHVSVSACLSVCMHGSLELTLGAVLGGFNVNGTQDRVIWKEEISMERKKKFPTRSAHGGIFFTDMGGSS